MGIIFDKPLIGVMMCQGTKGEHPIHSVHNKYLDAIFAAGGIPLALPHGLINQPELLENAMAVLSGILLTGSPSNIEPQHYGENGSEPDADPGRDRLAFALIAAISRRQMPLMAICRGLQELVVATGGTLHRSLSQVAGLQRHQEDETLPLTQQYAPVHTVQIVQGGLLSDLLPDCEGFPVNSLHQQGIRSTGPTLRTEALAADGLVEAVSLRDHPFALGVQWHPEWHSAESPFSRPLFAGFIQASQRYHKEYQS